MVLVDSSVYIQLLRSGRDPVAELAGRLTSTEIAGCDVVRCEVLRGVIRPGIRAGLTGFFDLLVHVTMDHRVWQETERLAYQLDRAGSVLPLTDIIIATCALHARATLLTNDAHFAMVPQLQVASW